jgi:RNA polymerase sigma-70 factor (ECF subfamily)
MAEDIAAVEAQIRQALQAGDRHRALNLAARHYYKSIVRFAMRYVRDDQRARDVAQVTFAAASEKIGGFAGQSTMHSWLCGIARHKALDSAESAKRARRRTLPTSGVASERWIGSLAGPGTGLQHHRDVALLREIASELSDDARNLLTLRLDDGLEYKEIAVIFGVKEGALRKRMKDLLDKLLITFEARRNAP